MTIEKIYNLSLILKDRFRAVERKEWQSFQYVMELFVQIGHLSDILLRQEHKLNNHSETENKKIIGDELGDIALNVISLCQELQIAIDFDQVVDKDNKSLDKNSVDLIKSLFVTAGKLVDSLSNQELVSKLSIELINQTYALANFFNIDMDLAFENLYHESLVFIARHSFPERVEDKSVRESNFSEEIIELKLDEQLKEYFLEELPSLELNENLQERPFLLVRPSALDKLDEIKKFLQEKGVKIHSEKTINNFENLARYLYPVNHHDSNSYMWFILTRAAFPETYNKAHIIFLDDSYKEKYDELYKIKTELKNMLGITRYKVNFEGKNIVTNLHHIHAADSFKLKKEFALIDLFLDKNG